jgi:DNA-directed RNA polymerase I, II, and III subunit RPABC1
MNDIISKINRAKEVIGEMLDQRGYSYKNEEDFILASNNLEELVIFFCSDLKFNLDKLKFYISKMNEIELNHCIIVYADQITSTAKKAIDNLEIIKPEGTIVPAEIELFSLKELQYNLTKHILVPLHTKLSDEESFQLKKKFGHNLASILKTDPVSRFYNFKKGDIIKITRKEGYIIYRIVK